MDNREIKGIGLSGQMHGLVMLDQDGNVLRRSIIWCDQRTAEECEEISRKVGRDRLIAVTANPALTGFTASKFCGSAIMSLKLCPMRKNTASKRLYPVYVNW